ncbi:MAG TPA: fumarylacetoacetate hydrolase family protein [Chloroflexia bacterium]|nr:fumarylacetoacetate hydrolase family protein [Chloroflexia bacterium]
MKLVAFSRTGDSRPRRGIVVDDSRIVEVPGSFRDLGDNDLAELAQALEKAKTAGESYSLDEVVLHAPVPDTNKIMCIGLNYMDHCLETGAAIPTQPILFAKFNNALTGHKGEIKLDGSSQEVDYEAELAFVIGKQAYHVSEEEALDYVAGYITANDVSARDLQFSQTQWIVGKSPDTFCPLGPWLVTKDEVPDPHNLRIQCRVNGTTLQDSNTGQLIFKIPALISFLSRTMTLEPGDIVLTGTPPGVGMARNPKIWLKPGDTVEIEIENVGLLVNPVVER